MLGPRVVESLRWWLVLGMSMAIVACGEEDPHHDPVSIEVALDVLPGAWPNAVDFDADGPIEIAILSHADFDATTVDATTLIASDLDRTAEVAFVSELTEQDVDGDGRVDVIGTVDAGELVVAGIVGADSKTRIAVSGETDLGDSISGWDVLLDESRPTLELPALSGPHPVGRVEIDWTDSSRTNQVGPRAGDPRRVKAQVWYPAVVGTRASPSPAWESLEEAHFMAEQYFHFPPWWDFGLPTDFFEYVSVPATRDAPIAADAPLPVLLFSHGAGLPAPAHSAFVSDIASHGFVVVSIYHPYITFPVAFSDGEMVTEYADADPEEAVVLMVEDMRFVLDQLHTLAAGDGRFGSALDLERVGVFGMSIGGAAAAQACADDDRFLAALNVDGTPFGTVVETGMDQPFFLVSAEYALNPANPSDPRPDFLDNVRGPTYSLFLSDAKHLNFSDYALHEPLMREVEPSASIPAIGTIDRALVYRITNDYIVAFFATHVAGDADPLLTMESPYPEAEFEQWP